MINSTDGIGERIRLQRLKCNMTQAELANGCITRNMLSLIENGDALPSLETLTYIANKLDIPVGKLLTDDEAAEALYEKNEIVTKAKVMYSSGYYSECADLCKKIHFDDEMIFLAAESELKEAENKIKSLSLKSAAENLEKALAISSNSIYISKDFEGTVRSYMFFIKCAITGEIDTDELGRLSKTPSRIPASSYVFLTLLSLIDNGKLEEAQSFAASYPFMTYDESAYFRAAVMLRCSKAEKAEEILKTLFNKNDIGFILKYRICADLEACSEILRDFEAAYTYSTTKHKMLDTFRR